MASGFSRCPILGGGWLSGCCRSSVYCGRLAERRTGWEPRRLTVEAQPGQSLTLGREALWAPRADEEHILLRREGNREWRLANISASKQVLWWPASGGGEQQIQNGP